MRFLLPRYYAIFAIAAAVGFASATNAEDSMCPDMPARQSALQEGQKYLENHESPATGVIRVKQPYGLFNSYRSFNSIMPTKPLSDSELESLPLETWNDLMNANLQGYFLERHHQFVKAIRLYSRILETLSARHDFGFEYVRALDACARSQILSSDPKLASENAADSNDDFFPRPNVIDLAPNVQSQHQMLDKMIRSIRRADENSPGLAAAKSLYLQELDKLHNGSYVHKSLLAWELVLIAALDEKANRLLEAKNYYIRAYETDKQFAKYLADFCKPF